MKKFVILIIMVYFIATGLLAQQDNIVRIDSGRTYNVGDIGPAGGLVFYDKGEYSNDWRYLEAAPAETEFRAQWGASGRNVLGTNDTVGSGKRNTQLIIEHLNHTRGARRAAQICADMEHNGFNDWFLPSKDELNLIYMNLAQKNLGGFDRNAYYWSSSQYHINSAISQVLNNGRHLNLNKNNSYSVRAVRAF